MTAAHDYTWDFNLPSEPARAPSLDDLGGAALVDDAEDPPVPPEMPYADQLNQWALQLAGVARIIPGIDIEIAFMGGNPTIVNVAAMSSILTTSYCQANLSVVHVATGIVIIEWTSGMLPPPRAKARASITDISPYPQPVVQAIANGVKIYTWNFSGSAADLPFVVSIL